MKIEFTTEQKEKIKALVNTGSTVKQIAKIIGRGKNNVAKIISEMGLELYGNNSFVTEEQKNEIAALYKNGEIRTLQEAARRIHVCQARARQILTDRGIDIKACQTTKEKEDQIANDYVHSGLDGVSLEKKYGVTHKVIIRIVRERGLVRQKQPIVTTAKERRNGMNNYDWCVFKYGKEEADRRRAVSSEKHRINATGSKNNMYGRPSPQGSGNGWKGWYRGTFFRSLRELSFIVSVLELNNYKWESGERAKYMIEYVDPTGQTRNYFPDYVVHSTSTIYEVKPKRLWTTPLIKAKAEAAKVWCATRNMTYILTDCMLSKEEMLRLCKEGHIVFQDRYLEKIKAYYGPEWPQGSAAGVAA